MSYGDFYDGTNKTVNSGDIVYANDINKINVAVDSAFEQVSAGMNEIASGSFDIAKAWASNAPGVRPDILFDLYSSKAYAGEAEGWASSATTVTSAKTGVAIPGSVSAKTYASNASSSASDAAAQAALALAYSDEAKEAISMEPWVSGTSYSIGAVRWSPIDYQPYRRKVAGAGTTDPSVDTANWAVVQIVSMNDATMSRIMFKDVGYTFVDKGDSGASTQTIDFSAGTHQRIRATGALTLAFSNWAPSGNFSEVLLELVGDGTARVVTFPVGTKFIKYDGATTTTFSDTMITLQSANGAIDWILFWTRDAGTTLYCKVIR